MLDLIPCVSAHAEVIAALHALCFEEAWSRDSVMRTLAGPGTFGYLGCVDGDPRGFVLCRAGGGTCDIVSIGVVPEARRCGLAGRLLEAAVCAASGRGAREMILEVAADDPAARRFYEGRAFKIVGRRSGYYSRSSGPSVDALVLRRTIIPGEAVSGIRG